MTDIEEQRNNYDFGSWKYNGIDKNKRYNNLLSFVNSKGNMVKIAKTPFYKFLNDKSISIVETKINDDSITLVYESVGTGLKGVANFRSLSVTNKGVRY